ncbi:hypothetical protein P9477_23270 [Enterobacter mori]|uniref:hypothetical protein n=1 Tax=Enterobacter mori TaxID=539813 RepID=UPI00398ACF20
MSTEVFNDPFEMFLALEDVNPNALSKTTLDKIEADKEAYKPEIITNEGWEESSIEDETPEPGKWDFLEDGNDIKFEDEVEDEEESTEDPEEFSDDIDTDEPDYSNEAYDVDLDTVITLPNGEDMTIEQLQNGYIAGDKLTQRETELNQREEAINQRYESAKNLIEIAHLETDKQLAEYANLNWDQLTDFDYRENKRYEAELKRKREGLINEYSNLQRQKEAAEAEAFRAKSISCVNVLKAEIPSWGDQLYGELMEYAIKDLEADESFVLKWNDPSLFKMAYKAMQFDKGIAKAKAKIKGAKTSSRYVSGGKSPIVDADAARKAQAAKDYASGKIGNEEAFAFLED